MKLLKEFYTGSDTEVLVEKSETGAKNYYIKGVFMQAEAQNRNGRVYPRPILENELNRYQQLISEKRSLGELGHPDTPTINLDKVSHLITELNFDGNNIYGKAKILPTPNGEITKSFINEGIKLGVSSRGVGSLKSVGGANQVQEDFKLSTVDIVADPSAPDAWVTGIMEGREWVYVDGKFMEQDIEHVQKTIRKASQKDVERVAAQLFESFLKKL
jgi:hypothetical protein